VLPLQLARAVIPAQLMCSVGLRNGNPSRSNT